MVGHLRRRAARHPGSTSPDPATTAPGSVITIIGGPATANIPGPHNDGADFYGIALVLLAIVVAIALTRVLVLRRRGGSPDAEGHAGR